jgi:H+-transporting ATPase
MQAGQMPRREFTVQSTQEAKSASTNPPDVASLSVPDTLAALQVNPDAGLTHAEVDSRRKEHGYNEVAEKRGHPVRKFFGKFWGISAWMLELIMVLSAVLGKYSDLAVVSALLVVNAVFAKISLATDHVRPSKKPELQT